MPQCSVTVNQHWCRRWLDVIRQQAIIWTNTDPGHWPSSIKPYDIFRGQFTLRPEQKWHFAENIIRCSFLKILSSIQISFQFVHKMHIVISQWSYSGVSMVVADGLAPIWCQDISNHHDDIDHLMHQGCPNMICHRVQAAFFGHSDCSHFSLLCVFFRLK